jgi:hypothetical protein
MSEYQYYDFRAIDRTLTEAEMTELRSISTRAEITSTSFTNHYEWGDLKADPLKLLEKYFDAFVYVANWGTRKFWLRFPLDSFDDKQLQATLPGEAARVRKAGKHLMVGFESELEGDWDDWTGWMGSLIFLRSDLMRGDLRCLYLGWLLCAQNRELTEESLEPSVPAGLVELSAPLRSLIEFLAIDEDLIAVAALTSAPFNAGPSRKELDAWIRSLPEKEKNDLVVTAVFEPGERWRNELLLRFQQQNTLSTSPTAAAIQRRRTGDLLTAADARADERTRQMEANRAAEAERRKAKEAADRAQYLDQLERRQEAIWNQISAHIRKRQPNEYDKAVQLLIDLRDLAARQGLESEFRAALEKLRRAHATKNSFLRRLTMAGL